MVIDNDMADGAIAHLVLDGTRKTKALDGFQRDWPNILISDDKTIAHIDAIWDQLGLGPFIASPTHRYKSQYDGGGAVVNV
jgi:4-hydroxy-3-polyprenylbenzoate decarboxylase